MLCSPNAETYEEEALPPVPDGLPETIHTPWQRMVSLLPALMDAPVALVLGNPAGPEALVTSRGETGPWTSDTSASLAAAARFSEKVVETDSRLLVADTRDDADWAENTSPPHGLVACLIEPIRHPDRSIFGTLCVLDRKPNAFTNQDLLTEFRHAMETHLALMDTRWALAGETKKNADLEKRLARESATDALTGLLNRHSFEERFHQEVTRHKRAERPLSIIICDLDRFRELNDTKGRAAGDALLLTLAQLFKKRLRTHDLVWRWGGDEFLLLLPDTPLMGAVEVVESVRALVEKKAQLETTRVTLSAGVTNFNPDESEDDCLSRCNLLLEAAKEKGRNCVILG